MQPFPNLEAFIQAILAVTTPAEARTFFDEYVEYLKTHHPSVETFIPRAQADIGWVFGEGMPLEKRGMWHEATGAEHPFGSDFRVRHLTTSELFLRGYEDGLKGALPYRPTPWRVQLS